jgi:hypothetical protein
MLFQKKKVIKYIHHYPFFSIPLKRVYVLVYAELKKKVFMTPTIITYTRVIFS